MATSEPDFFQISYSITRVLANAREPHESIASVLGMLASPLDWDFGVMWIVDDRRFVLQCTTCSPSGAFPMFERVCAGRQFSLGEGLAGAAWQERRPIWIEDLRTKSSSSFPRLSIAVQEGIFSGSAFPLYVPNGVLGVIEMFSRKPRASEPRIQEFWGAMGGQIGVFLEHARTRSELKELDGQLQMLAESANEAIFTIDENSTILTVNSAVQQTFGYSPAELIGHKITKLMPPEMAERHEHGVRRYVATGRRNVSWEGISLRGVHKSGRPLPLRISFAEFWRGGKRVFTGFAKLES